MLTQEGLVAFMSAEILTALGTQLPAPGRPRGRLKVGRQCGSPEKTRFMWFSVLGILGAWAQDTL